ncbi:MAG: 5-formyltetrahydrofolate cyclo-ligase [Candidatus Omnitrophica bacterium]|nr:5-formyltetrahydrofolate cyclo-ligase [Candidatus Omnitrophota bacterium]MBU4590216.1 5-formyltetrahydrofolate cyclo-ligase [Candidatus Omnitrophota bacterium]
MKQKEALRKRIKEKLDNQAISERRKKSRIIQEKLLKQKEFLTSRCVMLYISKGTNEVETRAVIKKALKMGKKVVLPTTARREKMLKPVRLRSLGQGLKKGPYGIYEPMVSKAKRPIRLKDIDLVIVPGIAFDRLNNRLGHGQGYYDNFLKRLPRRTSKVGLGFRFQMLKKIPTARHDISLTRVITN